MGEQNLEALVDQIYEAAVIPEQWPTVLDRISSVADGAGGILFTGGLQNWVASQGATEIVQDYIAQGWPGRTSRTQRLFNLCARHPGFLGDLDVYTPEEIESEAVYREFLRPRGWGWGAGTIISAPSGDVIAIDVERRYEKGPVEPEIIQRLDSLRPHLARAALLSGRLFLERIQSAVAALELIGLAAAVLGVRGRLMAANARMQSLMPGLLRERQGRIEVGSPAADALLASALATSGAAGDMDRVRSIPVAATAAQPAIILHLVPVRRAAHDIFSGAQAIMVVTPVTPKGPPSAELLQGLFDLTPAEARVARAIAQRQTINEIAAAFSLSRETIRSQVKAILAKSGCARQLDLAAMLAGTLCDFVTD